MEFDPRMEESWHEELRDSLQNMLGSSEQVVMAFFVEKSTSSWGIGGRRTDLTSKQRIIALTVKTSPLTKKMKVRLQVAMDTGAGLKIEKVHNLSHLSKIEGVLDDKSGRTFTLSFDLLQKQTVGPSAQWTMRRLDDRNRLLTSIFKFCKTHHGRAPKISGIDVVEMQLWAQKYAKATPAEAPAKADAKAPVASIIDEEELVDDEYEEAETAEIARVDDDGIVSKDEEEDMDALLGIYVLGIDEAEAFSERLEKELTALDTANVLAILENAPLVDEVTEQLDITMGSIEDMEEWLGAINVKIRYMREDIASIESRNNSLETQARNSTSLLNELHNISDRFQVPPEYVATLTAGTFVESKVAENVEACKWLTSALHDLEPPILDAGYTSMRAIREKRSELENLKGVFLKRATSFLRDYFSTVVEFMIKDKASFSQKGQLRRPDHADLRFKCRTYARMILHMKGLDKNSLQPLRKSFCLSLNLLLRREVLLTSGLTANAFTRLLQLQDVYTTCHYIRASSENIHRCLPHIRHLLSGLKQIAMHISAREFAKELQSSTVVKHTVTASLDRLDSGKNLQSPKESPSGSSTVSDAYASMLRTFIPYLVDESSFFASFMCFETQPLTPRVDPDDDNDNVEEETRAVNMDAIVPDTSNQQALESKALKEALQELLDGIQEDFYGVADWAHRLDPWSCVSMQGVTEKYLSRNKADATWFVHRLLDDLQVRISSHFNQVVDETSKQFERADRSQTGVLFSIIKFANLATLIESQIVGQNSRENIDAAYEKLAGTIFAVIENVARNDPRNAEIFALDNYAAFQDRMYELAAVTPSLEKFYNEAADAYAQACVQYAQTMINYQFERLFLFVQKVENLLLSVEPEKVSSYPGYTRTDLRKTLRASLSGVEKSLQTTHRRMQKSIQRPDVLSTLWNQYFKATFLDKYKALEEILLKCYKDENLEPSSAKMKTILDELYSA